VAARPVIASIVDSGLLVELRTLTTSGSFSGDLCRCDGDLTLTLHDAGDALIGSATLHPTAVSWERERFANDLDISHSSSLHLLLARAGINGASNRILGELLTVSGLHEGEQQFRPADDAEALVAHRVPAPLAEALSKVSGDAAGQLDQESVRRLTRRLVESEGDTRAVRQLFAWLGTATWPTEAISGDGQLVRRMLDGLEPAVVERTLHELSTPSEVMGAVAWAAFLEEDAGVIGIIEPAIRRHLTKS